MSVRDVRDREEVSAPVGRYSGVKGTSVGEDMTCGVSTGYDGGYYEVITVVRSVKPNKRDSGALIERGRLGVGTL
jgi:hypothetical protein